MIARIVVFACTALCVGNLAAMGIRPVAARCEYHANPLGIDVLQPRLSWQLESGQLAQKQSSYRVLVASSRELLASDEGDLWDTGKTSSEESIQIVYQGQALTTGQRCYWKVMVWDQEDEPSSWSEPAFWTMGLLEPADWKAEWIGYDKAPADPVKEESKVEVYKALYRASGNPALQVDLTKTLRDQVAAGTLRLEVGDAFAGQDPAPGSDKVLELEYALDGVTRKRLLNEGEVFNFLSTNLPELMKRSYLPSPYLRKEFVVKAPVKRAVVSVSAQGIFEMHLNGQRVGDEYFAPGWTDYRERIYYKTYDVTDLLKEGENAIGAMLGDGWFRGNISIRGQNQYGTTTRLLSQLRIDYQDGSSETIVSDPTWKASFGPILQSDMHAGEIYDARLEMTGWDQPGFDDSQWAAVDTGSGLDAQPLIEAYPGVPVRRIMELPVVKLTEPMTGLHVFDLGQNFSGWVRLKVNGKAGDKVVMRFGEMLNADGTVFTKNLRSARATDVYILKGEGDEVWEPSFTFHGFRYVEVSGLEDKPDPEMLTGIVIHSDAPMTSSFECSDPMLNQLHSNILWGQRSNYLEVPTDCPQRDERLGWTGDTQIYIRSGTYHQDVASFFSKWLVDLEDTQTPAGIYGSQAPVFHGNGSPGWSDAGIICPWTIYQVYGDVRVIEKHYDGMAQFIEFCRSQGLGGMGHGFGDWLAVGSNTPKELISTAYFAYSTSLMAEMAEIVGKTEDAKKYQELFEQIREHFQASFVDADGRVAGNSQTAYCMALSYDLLTETQRQQAADHLVERIEAKDYHLSVGFLGVSILLPTLTEIGRSDLAYRLLQNKSYPSWGYSVEQGATTIWERWNSWTREDGFNAGAMNSFNHYAYGACSEWMFYSMLGIDTAGASYKEIRMKPEIGYGVTWAKGHYDSIRGRIGSDWKVDGDKLDWKVEIPANTTATVYVPAKRLADVSESGQAIENARGIKFLREEGGRVVLRVESGTYAFAASNSDFAAPAN